MIHFEVLGTPKPQGSTRAFIPKGWKRAIITTDNVKLKPWRQEIAGVARSLNAPMFDRAMPLAVSMNFYFAKPPSVKRSAMTVKPDGDKLVRAVFDAITGILIADDAQVVKFSAGKFYGNPERVEISIQAAEALPLKNSLLDEIKESVGV